MTISGTHNLLVVTDLDATLLDDAYSYQAALPALEALRARKCPLVLNSSKTLAEMIRLARELETDAPIVAENGSVLAIPYDGCDASGAVVRDGYRIQFLGRPRREILALAHALRSRHGYRFGGFADWTIADVAARTGLSPEAAAEAHDRLGTEPIVWEDSEARFELFREALAKEQIRILRGGRFLHLMGLCDKAQGLRAAAAHFQAAQPAVSWQIVALGDSPNDLDMLSAADVAVVIPNPHHPQQLSPTAPRILRPDAPGPRGWNQSINRILQEFF